VTRIDSETEHGPKLLFPGLKSFYDIAAPLAWPIVRVAVGWNLLVHGWGKVARLLANTKVLNRSTLVFQGVGNGEFALGMSLEYAGLLGFGGIAGASIEIAKIIFFIALVLFLVSAVVHVSRGRRI